MEEWNIRWTSENGTVFGESRVYGVKIVDAINKFLRSRENDDKVIVGINMIEEKPIKKRKRLKDYEGNY